MTLIDVCCDGSELCVSLSETEREKRKENTLNILYFKFKRFKKLGSLTQLSHAIVTDLKERECLKNTSNT